MNMPITSEILKKYPNTIFIETGSYMGDGIQSALDAGFKIIYSIELSNKWQSYCINRFKNNSKVNIILGESQKVMNNIIKNINNSITFWLDGHYSGPHTAMGEYESPLIQELHIIGEHSIKTHTILIDDLRCWHVADHGFDTEILKLECLKINKEYH